MDCEGSDKESNFGRLSVTLIADGMPHASVVVAAAL